MLLGGQNSSKSGQAGPDFPENEHRTGFFLPQNENRKIHGKCVFKQNFHILTGGSGRYMLQGGVSQNRTKKTHWVRSEHPRSIGFGVKHIDTHVAFGRAGFTTLRGNEEKHGTHGPHGKAAGTSSSTQKCQTGKRS